jgi:hypothetical protein
MPSLFVDSKIVRGSVPLNTFARKNVRRYSYSILAEPHERHTIQLCDVYLSVRTPDSPRSYRFPSYKGIRKP